MTYRRLQVFTVILPTLIIGGFEYVRHIFLLPYLSMKTGNHVITVLTFLLSYLYAAWMFKTIRSMNERLAEEQARRAVYEERYRLARELHDGIAQALFFLNIKLKQGLLAEAQAAVADIDSQVRQAIFNLRCPTTESWSLSERLGKWLQEWSALSGIEVALAVDLPDNHFTPAQEVLLFGIIQEAFTNIRKHARAQEAQVSLRGVAGGWQLQISDDGVGIEEAGGLGGKYGIAMMQERAAKLGATLALQKRKTGGTELLIEHREREVEL